MSKMLTYSVICTGFSAFDASNDAVLRPKCWR